MPDSQLQQFKQIATESLGQYSARTVSESAGIISLLTEARDSTFSLTATQKDGKTALTVPTPFGDGVLDTNTELKSMDAKVNFDTNQLDIGADVRNTLVEQAHPESVNATQDTRIDASANMDDWQSSKPEGSIKFGVKNTLKDERGNVVIAQKADCTLEVKSSGEDQVVAKCNGSLTDLNGKEYAFDSIETLTGSQINVQSDGKPVGKVEVQTVKSDDKPESTEYKVKTTRATDQ